MTWHLKDRELERKLDELSNEEFSKNLSNRTDGGFVSYFGGWVSFTESSMQSPILKEFPRFTVFFSDDEVEDVPEYNPDDWNEYPAVTPPEDVPMRVETVCGISIYRECAIFENGIWKCERDGNAEEELYGHVKRFRPWSED